MWRNLLIFILFLITSPLFAGGVLISLPTEYRQHNKGPSCSFASITTCMRAVHLWAEADEFWSKFRGPGNPTNVDRRLNSMNIEHKMLYHSDEQGILDTLNSGRMVAVTWGKNHMVTIAGKVDDEAYIINNNTPTRYTIQPWSQFLSMHRRGGGWAVIILSGNVSKPIIQDTLQGFEK